MSFYLIVATLLFLLLILGGMGVYLAGSTVQIVAISIAAAGGLVLVLLQLYWYRTGCRMIDTVFPEERGKRLLAKIRDLLERIDLSAQKRYSEEIVRKQAKIEALQSQINPHFLYNTLDSIRGQALMDNAPVVADMAEALSMMFRYSISQKGNFVQLRDELRNGEHYLMLQRFRFDNKFSAKTELEDEALLECYVPRLTLQPIVENAIFHGLETKPADGQIAISVYATGKRLMIRVSDNGIGIPAETLAGINEKLKMPILRSQTQPEESTASRGGSGIAVSNVNQRIRLSFGDAYGLCFYSTPSLGTDVEIILPLLYTLENMSGEEAEFANE